MEKMKKLKEHLLDYIVEHVEENGLENINIEELGLAIDMIKDLSETIYKCTIVKAMEEHPEETISHLRTMP